MQNADVTNYVELMEEVKRRIVVVNALILEKPTLPYKATAIESIYLRKLPRDVDILQVDFSGRILHPGRFNEEVEVQRITDCGNPEGGRG